MINIISDFAVGINAFLGGWVTMLGDSEHVVPMEGATRKDLKYHFLNIYFLSNCMCTSLTLFPVLVASSGYPRGLKNLKKS